MSDDTTRYRVAERKALVELARVEQQLGRTQAHRQVLVAALAVALKHVPDEVGLELGAFLQVVQEDIAEEKS